MSRHTRRDFVKGTAVAGAALGLGFTPWQNVRGANEAIRVGVIGFRGRGKSHIGGALKQKDVRLVVEEHPVRELAHRCGARELRVPKPCHRSALGF